MILALNIGNTNITIGAIKGKTIVFQAGSGRTQPKPLTNTPLI